MKTRRVNIKPILLYFAIFALLMIACQSATEPKESEEIIDFSAPEFHTKLPSGLNIDIYELEEPPSTEPLVFTPVSNQSQSQILAIHENYRKEWFDDNTFFYWYGLWDEGSVRRKGFNC